MDVKSPERVALETTAEELGLKFPANIGDENLAAKIKEAKGEAQSGEPLIFRVLSDFHHNGVHYSPDGPRDFVELSDGEHKALAAKKVVEESPPD